jgi:hypothetical protein
VKEAVADVETEISQKAVAQAVLAIPDLEHAKTAVLNTPATPAPTRSEDWRLHTALSLMGEPFPAVTTASASAVSRLT